MVRSASQESSQPPPPPGRSAEERKERRKRRRPLSLPEWVLIIFVGIWVLSTLDNHHNNPILESLQNDNDNDNNDVKRQSQSKPQDDPYYGWQPDMSLEAEEAASCTVRDCFSKIHMDCPVCRDLPEQLGEAPQYVPENWIPQVTGLHEMYVNGHDAQGQPFPPPLSPLYCENMNYIGRKDKDENKQLLDQVHIKGIDISVWVNNLPKLFCGIYTMESAHATNVRVMRETWAPLCDGFLAFSTASDPRLPAMKIDHDGPEAYENMWQKSRFIWKFIGDHYLDDFDFFILGGEDMMIIPTNLKLYLQQFSPHDDLFAGRRFKGGDNYFNSGGAGYVLSRATLKKFVTEGFHHKHCAPTRKTSMEDVMIAQCLRKAFGIGLTDTRDEQGRERFHPFAPGSHLTWTHPVPPDKDWYEEYNKEWGLKLGVECCAPDSVSFHYLKKPAMVRHIFSLLYKCP